MLENQTIIRSPSAYTTWDNNGVKTTVPAGENISDTFGNAQATGFHPLAATDGIPEQRTTIIISLPSPHAEGTIIDLGPYSTNPTELDEPRVHELVDEALAETTPADSAWIGWLEWFRESWINFESTLPLWPAS